MLPRQLETWDKAWFNSCVEQQHWLKLLGKLLTMMMQAELHDRTAENRYEQIEQTDTDVLEGFAQLAKQGIDNEVKSIYRAAEDLARAANSNEPMSIGIEDTLNNEGSADDEGSAFKAVGESIPVVNSTTIDARSSLNILADTALAEPISDVVVDRPLTREADTVEAVCASIREQTFGRQDEPYT